MQRQETVLYHITPASSWPPDGSDYAPPSLEAEGFIHLSTAAQLMDTATRYYADRDDLLVLEIERASLDGMDLRWEHNAARGEDFPHLYGALPVACVVKVAALSWLEDVGDVS